MAEPALQERCQFSHDRSFLRNVGNRFWWIKGKKLEEVDNPEAFLEGEMGGE